MKQKDSGQDFDPKHRIIGAIVVVALAVILIPMILGEREPPPAPSVPQTLAPEAAPNEEKKVAITQVTTSPVRGQVEKAPELPPAPVPKQEPVKPVAEAKPVEAKAPAAKAQSPAESPRPSSGWVVQVGTFSNSANATRLERKLRAQGQPVLAERITLAGNKAVRLRVGPFPDRVSATKTQERIQKDLGVKGVVLSYP